MRSVVVALGRGRLGLQPKAQILCPVLGTAEQIVDLLEISRASLQPVFDHAPPPDIRRSVAYRAGDSLEQREFEYLFDQGQAERIECHRLGPREITVPVAQSPDLSAVGQGPHAQPCCRYGRRVPGSWMWA